MCRRPNICNNVPCFLHHALLSSFFSNLVIPTSGCASDGVGSFWARVHGRVAGGRPAGAVQPGDAPRQQEPASHARALAQLQPDQSTQDERQPVCTTYSTINSSLYL